MNPYPKNKPGYVIVRDGQKNFVEQIASQRVGERLAAHDYKLDYEVQAVDGAKWIPLIDLVPIGGEPETRARAALKNMSANELLIKASKEGDYELIKWALAAGADVNIQEDRALYFAVLHEHERCVQLLMNRGASPASSGIVAVALRNGNKNILESFSIMENVSIGSALQRPKYVQAPRVPESVPADTSAGFRCPNCDRLTGVRLDASDRGREFGRGSLLGAFTKTYRCTSCDYLW